MKIISALKIAFVASSLSLISSCDENIKSSSPENTSRTAMPDNKERNIGDDEVNGHNIGNTSAGLSEPPSMNSSNGSTAGQSGIPLESSTTGKNKSGHKQH
jgi:hypothetical protein